MTLGGFTPGLQVTLSGAVTGSGTVKSDGTAVVSGTMGSESDIVTATDGAGLTATSEPIDGHRDPDGHCHGQGAGHHHP